MGNLEYAALIYQGLFYQELKKEKVETKQQKKAKTNVTRFITTRPSNTGSVIGTALGIYTENK